MVPAQINFWAVFVTAVIALVIGAVWYSPKVFLKQWRSLINQPDVKFTAAASARLYFKLFVAFVVMTYVLAHFIDYVGATTIAEGLATGVWVWLGFVATSMFTNISSEVRPLKLWLINAGYQLVVLAVAGAILAIWA